MYEGSCATDDPWSSGLELTRTRPVFSAVSIKGNLATGSWVLLLVLPYVDYKAGTSNMAALYPVENSPAC